MTDLWLTKDVDGYCLWQGKPVFGADFGVWDSQDYEKVICLANFYGLDDVNMNGVVPMSLLEKEPGEGAIICVRGIEEA